MATDNIKNYPLHDNIEEGDRIKVYSKKGKFKPYSVEALVTNEKIQELIENNMAKVKKITLSPQDIFDMFPTPQIALAAPPSGSINNILGMSNNMVYVSSAYTTATAFLFNTIIGGSNQPSFILYGLSATENTENPASKYTDPAQTVLSTVNDLFITTDLQAADGDSPIDVYIVYETKVLI